MTGAASKAARASDGSGPGRPRDYAASPRQKRDRCRCAKAVRPPEGEQRRHDHVVSGLRPGHPQGEVSSGARQADPEGCELPVRRGGRPLRGRTSVDPYTEPVDRPPLRDDVTVAIVGGGFAGLITGARLRQAGIDDIRIIEKGGDFGGTWYWNRYPGAQCDVESYVYLPLLEETSYVPSEKYARAPEILEHCQRIAAAVRPVRTRAASRPRSRPSNGTATACAGASRRAEATGCRPDSS